MNIVEVLCKAKQFYETHPEYMGMCHCVGLALSNREYGISDYTSSDIRELIPEFNRNFLNAPKNRNSNEFWWETGTEAGRKARIDAFNKLIDFYGHTETV